MRWRRQRRFIIGCFIVFILLLAVLITLIEHRLRPTIASFAEAEAKWTAAEAIYQAVLEQVAAETSYEDLIHVEKDDRGRIVLMQANLPKVNRVASQAALAIQSSLQELRQRDIRFPLGQVLGSKLFAHVGPSLKLMMTPVGTVKVTPYDEFEAAGFNQTRHRIYLIVESTVSVIVPFVESKVSLTERVPIADTIILGEVPNVLLFTK